MLDKVPEFVLLGLGLLITLLKPVTWIRTYQLPFFSRSSLASFHTGLALSFHLGDRTT